MRRKEVITEENVSGAALAAHIKIFIQVYHPVNIICILMACYPKTSLVYKQLKEVGDKMMMVKRG